MVEGFHKHNSIVGALLWCGRLSIQLEKVTGLNMDEITLSELHRYCKLQRFLCTVPVLFYVKYIILGISIPAKLSLRVYVQYMYALCV